MKITDSLFSIDSPKLHVHVTRHLTKVYSRNIRNMMFQIFDNENHLSTPVIWRNTGIRWMLKTNQNGRKPTNAPL